MVQQAFGSSRGVVEGRFQATACAHSARESDVACIFTAASVAARRLGLAQIGDDVTIGQDVRLDSLTLTMGG